MMPRHRLLLLPWSCAVGCPCCSQECLFLFARRFAARTEPQSFGSPHHRPPWLWRASATTSVHLRSLHEGGMIAVALGLCRPSSLRDTLLQRDRQTGTPCFLAWLALLRHALMRCSHPRAHTRRSASGARLEYGTASFRRWGAHGLGWTEAAGAGSIMEVTNWQALSPVCSSHVESTASVSRRPRAAISVSLS